MTSLRRPVFVGVLFAAAAASALAQLGGSSAAEIKRITERYALTRTRIATLLDRRLNPVALPANPPNPFYQQPTELLNEPAREAEVVPETADISDIDTLRKYAPTLRVAGIITHNGLPHLVINNLACKAGDIITVGTRDQPIYLKLLDLSATEFTLGLNEATLTVPVKK